MKLRTLVPTRVTYPLLAALSSLLTIHSAHSAPLWYDGGTNNWTTLTAWSTVAGAASPDPGTAPGASDDVTFNRTNNNTAANTVSFAGGNRSALSMTFSTTGASIFRANGTGTTARTLNLGSGGLTINSGAGAVTIGDTPGTYGVINVAMTNSQTWTNNSSNTFTFGGVVSGTGFNFTKTGSGQIRLNGINTYTGTTNVTGGDLSIGSYTGLSTTSSITVSGGTAALNLVQVGSGSTSNTINKPLSLHGFLRITGGSGTNLLNQTWDGNITLAGDSTITNNGNSTFDINGQIDLGSSTLTYQADRNGSRIDGNIIGTGSFIKTSVQNLTLTGSNTFSGNLTVSSGTLIGTGATNSPGVSVFGARDNTRTITVSSGAALQFNSGNILGANHTATTAPTLIVNGGTVTNGGTATNNALNSVQLNGGTLTATTGSASGYGAWNLNGNVTSSGSSTISTSDAVNGTVMLKVSGTTDFDVTSGTLTTSAPFIDNMNDSNTGALSKSGTGTMVLSGTNTYTGATTITAGTLTFSGSGSSNTSSGITVNGSDAKLVQASSVAMTPTVTLTQGTVTGSGTINTVNAGDNTGGIVSNNNGVAGAPLTIGSLNFNGAATVNTFSNSTSAAIVTTSLSSNAAGMVTINPTAAVWAAGTYDLISYGGGSIGGAGFSKFQLGSVSGISPRQSRVLGNSGTAITFTVGADDTPYWVGDGDGKWNLASTNNWKLSSNNNYTTFLAFDNAIFNDSATGAGPVIVDIDTAPVNVTTANFQHSAKDYVLSGAFGIAAGSLTKSGTGTLTITNANSYTGNTLISGGVLDVSTDGAQLYSGETGIPAAITVTNGGVLVVRNYGQSNAIGLGSPSLGNLNNGGGQVVLDGGTLRFNGETGTRGRKTDIGAGGGTLDVVNNSTLILNTTGNFNFTGASTLTLTGDASSTGNIQGVIAGTGVSLVKTGAATWTLSGNNTYTGTTTVTAGTLVMGTSNRIPNSSKISIAGGAKIDFSTGASANFTLSAAQDVEGTGTGTALFNTGNNAANGVLTTGDSTFSHSGAGTLVFQRLEIRGALNDMTGGNIQVGVAGTRRGLVIANNGNGDFTISGGTLTSIGGNTFPDCIGANGGTGTFTLSGGNYVNSGTLSFGVSGTNHPGGIFNINSGSASIGTLLYTASATGSQILNLNGGTLTVGTVTSSSAQPKEFNFDGGQFVASGGLTFPADLVVNVKNGGANVNTNGFSATIASSMLNAGTGGLVKSGLGTLTLTGSNTYAGATLATAGALRFSTAAASTTNITVSGGAEAGALVAADDAQWVNTGNLTLENSGAVLVDYGSTIPTTNASFTPISLTNFAVNATPGVRLSGAAVSNLQVGMTYPLVTWSGTGPTNPAVFSLLTHRLAGTFSIASNTLSVTITANASGLPISWNTGNGAWNTSSVNWVDGTLVNASYVDPLDAVVFGDAAGATGNPVVTLDSVVSPLSVTMNTSARNYTVQGTGSISGSGALLLSSSNVGTFTLSTGNNTFSGGTVVNGGTLALGHATNTLPDAGNITIDGASAVLNLGSNADTVGLVTVKNGASILGTGTLTGTAYATESGTIAANLSGSGALNKTTAGTLVLSGSNSYTGGSTISEGTLELRSADTIPATGVHLLSGGTTVRLVSDTALTGLGTLSAGSSTTTSVTFVSDRITAGSGLMHAMGTPNFGNTTLNFTKGANVASGTAGFILGGIGMTAGAAGNVVLNPIDATVSIIGSVSIPANNQPKGLTLAGDTSGNEVSGVISNGINTVSVTKQGTSTWTITGANTYTGMTTVDQGSLVFATTDQVLSGGLTFGASAGSTNVGSLDLSAASATFGGGLIVRTNAAIANNVTIGAGETLTFTGSTVTNAVTVGNNASSVLANFQASGAGTLAINEATSNIVVASADAGGASANMDLTNLANFTANVANIYIGRPTSAAGAAAGGRPADSMNLAAANNISVSGNLVVGGQASVGFQGSCFLRLGTTNVINANALVIGNGRINGNVSFNTGLTNPSAILRGATGGTSRLNINLGDQANGTAVGTGGGGSNVVSGTMDFTNGTVDAMIDTMVMGLGASTASNNRGRGVGTFTFGSGSAVDINNLIIGRAGNVNTASSNQPQALAANGNFQMNGGSLVVNSSLIVANDNDTSNTTNGIQDVSGTFSQSGGNAIIGSLAVPVDLTLGSHVADGNAGIATPTVNLTGGTTSVYGNIVEGNVGSGTITSTFTLNGGSLDMNGNNIGVAGSTIDALSFESGTLKNVASINQNGGLTKTTAGTLLLDGVIGYTGATTVTAGTLALANGTSINSSSAVNLGAAGTLDTTAQASYAIPASQPLTIVLDPTDAGSSGKIAAADLNITNAAVTLSPTAALNDPVYVIATYTGTLTGSAFASVSGLPGGYTINYAYEGNKIALVQSAGFASWIAGSFANGSVDIAKRGPNDDPDNDGVSNLLEYAIAGQDPTVANTAVGNFTGSIVSYNKRQPLAGDLTYALMESTDLGLSDDWTEVSGAGYTNNGTTVSYSFTPGTPAKNFFQLKVTQTTP